MPKPEPGNAAAFGPAISVYTRAQAIEDGTRRRWCSPAPWRRCRTPYRPTARCCPSAW